MGTRIRAHIPTEQSIREGFGISFSPYDVDMIADVPIGIALGPFDVRFDRDGDMLGAFLMSGRLCWLLHGDWVRKHGTTRSFVCGAMTTRQKYANYVTYDEFVCDLGDYHDEDGNDNTAGA